MSQGLEKCASTHIRRSICSGSSTVLPQAWHAEFGAQGVGLPGLTTSHADQRMKVDTFTCTWHYK